MTHRVKRPPLKITLCPNAEMCVSAGFSSDSLKQLRVNGTLPRGIYWQTMPNSDRILWNRDLVLDYLLTGNSVEHQKAVDQFRASLPSSESYQSSAA